jgi:hypothetical protein
LALAPRLVLAHTLQIDDVGHVFRRCAHPEMSMPRRRSMR